MSLITVSNLTFCYEGSYDSIFENVSFQFDTGWKLGFTGRNGRGKTTFLKLLMGEHEYQGTISSSVSFGYFPFPVSDPEQDTLAIVEQVAPNHEFWELCRELNLLQVPEDVLFRPFQTLSYGEQTKTLLAALFLRQDTFLLLDEPTNHLDYLGRESITRYLQKKKGFLLVSHDRMLLDQVTDHTLSINRTNIDIQKGSYTQWLAEKKLRDQGEAEDNQRLKKDITKLRQAARRTASWSDQVEASKFGNGPVDRGAIGAKAAKMMKRAKVLETRQNDAINEKSKLLRNIETQEPLKLFPLQYHSQVVAQVSNLSIAYGANTVFQPMSFTLHRGERIALKGKNGCGKSSLVKLLAGQALPHTGTARLSSGVTLSYVPQDASFLSGSLTAFAEQEGLDRSLFLAILRKLAFERVQFEKNMEELSEGQKKKVLIAKSLCQPAHLYLWDEPLNYMDILSREQIEELLLAYPATMLFVEHDETFIQKIATNTVLFDPGTET